jgi:hypothetical protein
MEKPDLSENKLKAESWKLEADPPSLLHPQPLPLI